MATGNTAVDGLRIVWDPGIDKGAWPGPLDGRSAVAGEAWLGPMGLVARLETELGLGAIHATPTERSAHLARHLASNAGWWSDSHEADPLGTAQRLLRDRDELCFWNWRGESASERLTALWNVTQTARPGLPDRIRSITSALTSEVDIASIELHTPIASLAPLWRALFTRLDEVGVRVTTTTTPTASSTGDLASARTTAFVPVGDGSLVLFRAHGPLAAADEIAAHLASLSSLDGVLIIGADDVLDAALARHGLPRVGAATRPTASAAVLRLVVEAAFEPMDPADLHALLSLAVGPIPRRVGASLIRAIARFPGRRTDPWKAALEEGLARVDEDRRDATRARIETLLMPAARREAPLSITELDRRLAVVGDWARARIDYDPSLVPIAAMIAGARALLRDYGEPALTLVQLRRLCDDLDPRCGLPTASHAGLASVADPSAVLGPARMIVWWSFTRDSAPSVPRVRLSNVERSRLPVPPDPGLMMEGEAKRWRRPLDYAIETLLLVCPHTSDAGEEASPHPLWDELRAAMREPQHAALLESTRLGATRRTPARRALPVVSTTINAGTSLVLRERESPSSLDKLLGCSFAWALTYHGKLYGGISDGAATPTALLYGNLAHLILAQVFGGGVLDAAAARARAREILDHDLDLLAENLALPRYQIERTTVRQAILESAHELGALLTESGARIRGVELPLAGELASFSLGGSADLVLESPDAVIDLKWGHKSHRDKLKAGTALQLAIYAELSGASQVGYFSLTNQELYTPPASTLPRAQSTGNAAPRDIWAGALVALGERRTELAAGELFAPAADGTRISGHLAPDRLTLAPPCRYCSFSALCGLGGSK